ncbi:ATP-binding cassette domain-containing protein [Flagellimonas flava]|uniref:Molybdate transport system ATP-binding protein n=1 Tax=Flagellimonas flava TaxID=570519 RepID=A0A1M5NHZ9_9FLAO|nr:ATP-binding cassette domain-containing protein [Allomuricauda flava]SHG88839.1 molybdate transport system ATP-binding protein [Allomuricauda flava]
MRQPKNYAILAPNNASTQKLVKNLLKGHPIEGFEALTSKNGLLFSRSEINRYMDEEERHDIKVLTKNTSQSLKSMSSGEQKKALLAHLMSQQPDFLVLVNPFDNLDIATQEQLRKQLTSISESTSLVQVVSRLEDILPITSDFFSLSNICLKAYTSAKEFREAHALDNNPFQGSIPPPLVNGSLRLNNLVSFKGVSVSFDGRQVLDQIDWEIKQGEFWQLVGPNGSGKTTLLSMITGDNHKGYGQDLTLFGQKKGSGESVWDHKRKIGYFTPSMTDKFRGYHSVENMVVSGFHDSVGLYIQPSDQEKRVANQWIDLLGLKAKANAQFFELSQGERRLVMTARAMVKHPPLLILDEPTAGLDDINALLFISLVNKIAQESDTAIVFVSHRKEPQLKPKYVFELIMTESGSKGVVKTM